MDKAIINAVIKKIKEDLVNGQPKELREFLYKVYKGEADVCDLVDYAGIEISFSAKDNKQ